MTSSAPVGAATARLVAEAPDLSLVKGHFLWQQMVSAALLGALLVLVLIGMGLLGRRRDEAAAAASGYAGLSPASITGGSGLVIRDRKRWRLLVGLDNRVSTSRTVALLWTLAVAYILLTLTLIALADQTDVTPLPSGSLPTGWVDAAFKQLDAAYLAALVAVPVGTAVAAKSIVTSKVRSRRLQKTTASRASVADLVTDDSGNFELMDFQYATFNAIAIVFVLTQFAKQPGAGFPPIPVAFATLIVASAGIYTTNKATSSNPARIDTILTPRVAAGESVTLVGSNLAATGSAVTTTGVDGSPPASSGMWVTLSSPTHKSPPPVLATQSSADRVTFTVPPGTEPSDDWTVVVTTDAGGVAVRESGLSVAPTTAPDGTLRSPGTAGPIGVA